MAALILVCARIHGLNKRVASETGVCDGKDGKAKTELFFNRVCVAYFPDGVNHVKSVIFTGKNDECTAGTRGEHFFFI